MTTHPTVLAESVNTTTPGGLFPKRRHPGSSNKEPSVTDNQLRARITVLDAERATIVQLIRRDTLGALGETHPLYNRLRDVTTLFFEAKANANRRGIQ